MISAADFDALNDALRETVRPGRSRCAACKRPLTDRACPSIPWPRACVPGFSTFDFLHACDAQCAAIVRRRVAARVARDRELNPRERMCSLLENITDALAGKNDEAEAAE